MPTRLTKEQLELIVKRYNEGVASQDIAMELGIPRDRMARANLQLGLDFVLKRKEIKEIKIARIPELHARGMSSGEIGEMLELSGDDMWKATKKFGITFHKGASKKTPPLSAQQIEEIIELTKQEWTAAKISKKLDITHRQIIEVYEQHGLKTRGKKRKPLTIEQNELIIKLFNEQRGARYIAKELGVTRDCIIVAFRELGLDNSKRTCPKNLYRMTQKICHECKITKNITCFGLWEKDGGCSYDHECFDCQEINKQKRAQKRKERRAKYKVDDIIGRFLWRALRSNHPDKPDETDILCEQYLGYTAIDLRNHIQKLFECENNLVAGRVWMKWENRGKYLIDSWKDDDPNTWVWNLDHEKPWSDFEYTKIEDGAFKECWALTNLRPLKAKQNVIEGVRRTRHKKKSWFGRPFISTNLDNTNENYDEEDS